MKKLLLITAVLGATTAYTPNLIANDRISSRLCEYISVNDKKRLRSFLKIEKVKIRKIFKDVQCDNQNLLEFAASSKALDIGEFLISKLPVKTVAKSMDVISQHSAHLATAAQKRIK